MREGVKPTAGVIEEQIRTPRAGEGVVARPIHPPGAWLGQIPIPREGKGVVCIAR